MESTDAADAKNERTPPGAPAPAGASPPTRELRPVLWGLAAIVGALLLAFLARHGIRYSVEPAGETEGVPHTGDAADDPAIWVSPLGPDHSLILGTDKKGGLCVFGLDGKRRQYLELGRVNNVDVRDDFPFRSGKAPIVALTNKSTDTIDVLRIDPATGVVTPEFKITPPSKVQPDGFCLFHDPRNGAFHAITATKEGEVLQFRIDEHLQKGGELVRRVKLGSESEGCVADDARGVLYVCEENVGIWRMKADPHDGDERSLVDRVSIFGRLRHDIEGLAIWGAPDGTGFLVVSDQGSNDFLVYTRDGDNHFVGRFAITSSDTVDGVDHTDGIDIVSTPLGARFPDGLLVVQDDKDDGDESRPQNFKLVSWREVIRVIAYPL